MFAIVIPNYNQSGFLSTALESINKQSVPFNLAIMDGGSTDNFKEVIQNYTNIITFVQSGPDKGQASAIKNGKKSITGNIVSWLNADDYYFSDALEKVEQCFRNNPDIDVVYGDAIHVTPEGYFISYFHPVQKYNRQLLNRTCFICQPACFVRRSAYEKIGGVNPGLHYTMDWDLWCRLAGSGAKFYYLQELLAAVRYYPGTKTLSGDIKRYLELWRVERKYGNRLVPLSWPGAYLYELRCKKSKTYFETLLLNFLFHVRDFKYRFSNKLDIKRNHVSKDGFNRWNNQVVGKGTINLPWYDKRQWKNISFKVRPDAQMYRVTINDSKPQDIFASKNWILVNLQEIDTIERKISIECLGKENWQLIESKCELIT